MRQSARYHAYIYVCPVRLQKRQAPHFLYVLLAVPFASLLCCLLLVPRGSTKHITFNMAPVQGTGKAPNIANPNMPSKAPSVAGSAAPTESAAAVAKDDPAKAIEKLETRTKAVNANNVARVANSHLTSNDAKLNPLVSLKTGKPLDKFPESSAGIAKLTCEFEISFSVSCSFLELIRYQ